TLGLPEPELAQIPIVPTYHPAAILRKDYYLELVLADFERAIGILKGHINGKPMETHYYRGVAPAEGTDLVIDLETIGLDMFKTDSDILCFGSSTKAHKGWVTQDPTQLRLLLEDTSFTKVGHNLKFDLKWLITHG